MEFKHHLSNRLLFWHCERKYLLSRWNYLLGHSSSSTDGTRMSTQYWLHSVRVLVWVTDLRDKTYSVLKIAINHQNTNQPITKYDYENAEECSKADRSILFWGFLTMEDFRGHFIHISLMWCCSGRPAIVVNVVFLPT